MAHHMIKLKRKVPLMEHTTNYIQNEGPH